MNSTRDAVLAYRERRKRRLDQKAVDRFLERRHNRIEVRGDDEEAHGNTKIPYGLCERYGIKVEKGWEPRDAWAALEEKGVSPDDVYKGMREKTKKERRMKKYRAVLKPKPNQAVFFSNCSMVDEDGNEKTSQQVAREYAENNDGVTMEILMAGKLDMPDFDLGNKDSLESWKEASGAYAEQASGDVRVYATPPLREGNIFENVELPMLKANSKVTSVTMINPETNERIVIFRR